MGLPTTRRNTNCNGPSLRKCSTNITSVPLENWKQQHGAVKNKGIDFTNLVRWNTAKEYIYGSDLISNYKQLFATEDVIMVTGTMCSSACSISADLMRKRAGVRKVALEGQPRKDTMHVIANLISTPEEAARSNKKELDTSAAGKSVADSAWLGRNFRIVGSVTLHYPTIRKRELSFEEKDHNKVEQ
ncbi:hypothetical protein BM1_00485 [Bipolaris maydis]|nr:hypothetical protein BM1_00485 [Bipolaris maydis]